MLIKMQTILITNSRTAFGKQLIKSLKVRHNLIVTGNIKSDTYSILSDNIDHINSNLLQDTFCYNNYLMQEAITQATKIVDHGNQKYNGINICVDCSNSKLNEFNLSALILHQAIANNCITETGKNCKLLYNNNRILPMYFNNQFPEKVSSYNCEGDVDTAIAIIEDNFKFSTGMDVPYFDFDQNLITSRL